MEPAAYIESLKILIRNRITELRQKGVRTSKGEKMSMAAIGRALDPPVSHVAVLLVIDGKTESRRIKDGIERELDRGYWIRKKAA
jgi:hypothetical protein